MADFDVRIEQIKSISEEGDRGVAITDVASELGELEHHHVPAAFDTLIALLKELGDELNRVPTIGELAKALSVLQFRDRAQRWDVLCDLIKPTSDDLVRSAIIRALAGALRPLEPEERLDRFDTLCELNKADFHFPSSERAPAVGALIGRLAILEPQDRRLRFDRLCDLVRWLVKRGVLQKRCAALINMLTNRLELLDPRDRTERFKAQIELSRLLDLDSESRADLVLTLLKNISVVDYEEQAPCYDILLQCVSSDTEPVRARTIGPLIDALKRVSLTLAHDRGPRLGRLCELAGSIENESVRPNAIEMLKNEYRHHLNDGDRASVPSALIAYWAS
jgi:hypothetical protein